MSPRIAPFPKTDQTISKLVKTPSTDEAVRRKAISAFIEHIPRGSTPGSNELVSELRTLQYSLHGPPVSTPRRESGAEISPVVARTITQRAHEAIDAFHNSNQDVTAADTLWSSIDSLLDLASTQRGVEAFTGLDGLSAPQQLGPVVDGLHLETLNLSNIIGPRSRLPGEPSWTAAHEAVIVTQNAIRQFVGSTWTPDDVSKLRSAADDAQRILVTDAGIRQFETLFPSDGKSVPLEKALSAVQNLQSAVLDLSFVIRDKHVNVRIDEAQGKDALKGVSTALNIYKQSKHTTADRNALVAALNSAEAALNKAIIA